MCLQQGEPHMCLLLANMSTEEPVNGAGVEVDPTQLKCQCAQEVVSAFVI